MLFDNGDLSDVDACIVVVRVGFENAVSGVEPGGHEILEEDGVLRALKGMS